MIELFYVETGGADEGEARFPGRSKRRGSAFAVSLLAYAVRLVTGGDLPEIAGGAGEKPYFPTEPGLHFSYSHTSGAVLCAVSSAPVGVDVERIRELRPALPGRLATDRELELFGFFGLWTLRESLYKLRGGGSLREGRFDVEDGVIVSPERGVVFGLYSEIPGCAAALGSEGFKAPSRATRVKVSAICT